MTLRGTFSPSYYRLPWLQTLDGDLSAVREQYEWPHPPAEGG